MQPYHTCTQAGVCVCVCVCVCVRACMRACVHACVCVVLVPFNYINVDVIPKGSKVFSPNVSTSSDA